MHITMVKKRLADGSDCRKCNQAVEHLKSRGLWARIDEVVLADERDPGSVAFDNEEIELGLRCIAAPVRDDTGELVAGLSVSAPADRHSPDWAAIVRQTADEISAAIGYMGTAHPPSASPRETGG